MSGAQFTIDTSEVSAMSKALAGLTGQYNWIVARAMTNSAKAAKAAIAADTFPRIQGGPAGWTRRGLMVSFARHDNLTSNVGFNYGDGSFTDTFAGKGMGTPAGRYMEVNTRGGDRSPKRTEIQLRRAGIIGPDQFVTPASSGVRLNAQGNASASQYQQILSRVKSFSDAGSNQNTKDQAKRKESDYFLMRRDSMGYSRWELGADPVFIAKRVGRGPKGGTGKGSGKPGRPQTVGYRRGFVPALFITDQPNYERRFRIQPVAMAEYRRVFSKEFESALEIEMAYQAKKAR